MRRDVSADHRVPMGLPLLVVLGLATAAGLLCWMNAAAVLPPSLWLHASEAGDIPALVFRYATLPRFAASLVAGAALGLAGALFQQALRNPLAVPDTLGVGAGAQLALAAAALWAPTWLVFGRAPIAFLGSGLALSASLALAWRHASTPATVILSGLIVTLYASACGMVLLLLHAHNLSGLLVWASGSFSLQDWRPVTILTFAVTLIAISVIPLVRPLTLLAFDDATVRGIGLPVGVIRVLALTAGVGLSALVTATFGSIGFIGLGAPVLARATGARRFGPVAAWSILFGALLLWFTDGAVSRLSDLSGLALPTGSATALFGVPLLIAMIGRSRAADSASQSGDVRHPRRAAPWLIAALAVALVLVAALAIIVGRLPDRWWLALSADFDLLVPWRLPRVIGAGAAGALLALSGLILQRVSNNPMASPEMFGLSAGAGAGLFIALCLGVDAKTETLGAVGGAAVTAFALLAWSARRGFSPTRLMLLGLALTTSVAALIGGFAATGDPRALRLMTWMAGSTAQVSPNSATIALLAATVGVPLSLLSTRWLDLLSVGSSSAQALGLTPRVALPVLCLLAAALAGAGTLIVGPLSFAGLIGPHLARRSGLQRAFPHVLGTALTGAVLMILADWIGRVVDVPWQLPAGLVAALIGGPILAALL